MNVAHQSEGEAAAQLANPSPTPNLLAGSTPPKHNVHAAMNFEQLIAKVTQAEDALEAQERRFVADVRQFKRSWKSAWTPPRIVVAGLVTGFFAGRAEPLKFAGKGGSMMQVISMVSGLFATEKASEAAHQAEKAADTSEAVAGGAVPTAAARAAASRVQGPAPELQAPEPARFVAPLD